MTSVPFVDLSAVSAQRARLLADIDEVIASGAFVNGPQVAEFEEAWAKYCQVEWCVGVSSGLDALRLVLECADAFADSDVIVPAMTFQASWEAVTLAGYTPRPVDVDADGLIDPGAAARAITDRAVAIMPVHLYGRMADMRAVGAVASEFDDLVVVEDACQAHGASRDGVTPGQLGDAACFSFYPTKNLGAFGDAGAIVTRHEALADHARVLRDHGQTSKGVHDFVGYTARLDTIQAVVLLRKLAALDEANRLRADAARTYAEQLVGVDGIRLPLHEFDGTRVWHVYDVRVDDQKSLVAFLADRGVATGRHYPTPPHLTDAYRHLGYERGDFPVAEEIARTTLSLPLYPGITEEQQAHVAACVREWLDA